MNFPGEVMLREAEVEMRGGQVSEVSARNARKGAGDEVGARIEVRGRCASRVLEAEIVVPEAEIVKRKVVEAPGPMILPTASGKLFARAEKNSSIWPLLWEATGCPQLASQFPAWRLYR